MLELVIRKASLFTLNVSVEIITPDFNPKSTHSPNVTNKAKMDIAMNSK